MGSGSDDVARRDRTSSQRRRFYGAALGSHTITVGAAAGASAIASSVATSALSGGSPRASDAPYRWEGGTPVQLSGNGFAILPLTRGGSPGTTSFLEAPWRVSFEVTLKDIGAGAGQFEFDTRRNGSKFVVWIDEQPSAQTTLANDGGGRSHVLVGTTAGSHRVTIEGANNFYFDGVRLLVTEDLRPPAVYSPLKLAIVGDSYSAGYYGDGTAAPSTTSYGAILSRLLGIPNTMHNGSSGTGFVNANTGSGNSKYGDRLVNEVKTFQPDILLLQGSVNDPQADANLGPNVTACIAEAKTWTSKPLIVVTGPLTAHAPSVSALANSPIILAAATAAGADIVVNCVSWVTGNTTGKSTAPAGIGTEDIFCAADGIHPTAAGHDFFARRLASVLAPQLGIAV